jgi:hypothetical protein
MQEVHRFKFAVLEVFDEFGDIHAGQQITKY